MIPVAMVLPVSTGRRARSTRNGRLEERIPSKVGW